MVLPSGFQLENEVFLVVCNSLFNFLPSHWAVLVIYANKFMDNSVNFVLILTCDFYSCFFEDFLKMPEVARHGRSL